MTIDEFNEFKWCPYYKAKYRGKWYNIECIDFKENLIGLSEPLGIKWVRCENVSVGYNEPEGGH